MITQIEHDDLDDGLTDEDNLHIRAIEKFDKIVETAKRTLTNAGISIDVFFLVPTHGILLYGTPADDVPDDLWNEVSEIVTSVVARVLEVERFGCREVLCAMAHIDPAI